MELNTLYIMNKNIDETILSLLNKYSIELRRQLEIIDNELEKIKGDILCFLFNNDKINNNINKKMIEYFFTLKKKAELNRDINIIHNTLN